ncbi:MAG: PaaI family thioesterase [Gammaproteobacteria bacterium]|nr:MAG: PaaI family thioesterase [Gammaproteobacteria bacterium]
MNGSRIECGSQLKPIVAQAHESGDYRPLIESIPYARTIGLEVQRLGNEVLFILPPKESNLGNPVLPALHGGVIGGFLELSASLHLVLFQQVTRIPRIVDFSLDYLRAAKLVPTYAECRVTRQGRRVANVMVSAWQKTRTEPIATARAHFLIED